MSEHRGEPTVITDATIEAVTLHADGTFGVMFRRPVYAVTECTCGWVGIPEDHDPEHDPECEADAPRE